MYAGRMPGKDTNIGAKRARELRDALGLAGDAPAVCLLTLVEGRLRIPVVVASLPDGIAGCCWRDSDATVLWVNGMQPATRQRFTLAHELGHLRCHHNADVPVDTVTTLAGKTTDGREIQANAFAAELLVPAAGVSEMLGGEPTLADIVRIAARYGVSTIVALYRLNTLGFAADYERLEAEFKDGLYQAPRRELDRRPVADVFAQLSPHALPRLSPALRGSGLDALLTGRSSVAEIAATVGCPERTLGAAAGQIATR